MLWLEEIIHIFRRGGKDGIGKINLQPHNTTLQLFLFYTHYNLIYNTSLLYKVFRQDLNT